MACLLRRCQVLESGIRNRHLQVPFFVKFRSYPSSDPVDPTDFYRPNKLWPAEAIEVYNKLNEDTKSGKWKRYISAVRPSDDGIRQFGKAADGKMFTGALFYNEEEKISKGVVTFQSWTEGPPGHVHGGAIATILDTISGTLTSFTVEPCLTKYLNVNYNRLLNELLNEGFLLPVLKSGFLDVSNDMSVKKCNFSSETVDYQDVFKPNESWPAEAIEAYNKFNKETKLGKWRRITNPENNGVIRNYVDATNGKMFTGAFFYNVEERKVKAVITFQSWTQGPKGHVHGGAIATVFDEVLGTLASSGVALSVTRYLNVTYKKLLPLHATVLVHAQVDRVDDRKIFLSAIMKNLDDTVIYGDSNALFIDVTKSKL